MIGRGFQSLKKEYNMRLEHLTEEKIDSISDADLKNLKNRAEQLFNSTSQWGLHIQKNKIGLSDPIDKSEFYSYCTVLYKELHKRGLISTKNRSHLETKLLKKAFRGIDTRDLPVLVIQENVATIGGDFVNNPLKTEKVLLKTKNNITSEITKKIKEIVHTETKKEVILEKNLVNKEIPLYDLALVPKDRFEELTLPSEVSKEPEPLVIQLVKKEEGAETEKPVDFVKNQEQRLVGGIIYEPNVVDADGDVIDNPDDIFHAMKTFMLKGGIMKVMHEGEAVSVYPVESFQPETDIEKGGSTIPAGAWYMTAYVDDDGLWEKCKNGEFTGFSMSGRANFEVLEE